MDEAPTRQGAGDRSKLARREGDNDDDAELGERKMARAKRKMAREGRNLARATAISTANEGIEDPRAAQK
ncbi:hypothetical protein E2562_009715 [Oryza meyeriana var. granulata]|uniref:IBB domain-containing protein n=1 Tax=Oryza meyeriana var. granulata TaxID=110450 RepID=A0A6G1D2J7_9ORYZ|nr:hypothetical protein E2562_009715 [Oryza meyeriana var. granulata]